VPIRLGMVQSETRSLLMSTGRVKFVPREERCQTISTTERIVLASDRAIVQIPVSRVHHYDRGALE
jgi:hypothetical protein